MIFHMRNAYSIPASCITVNPRVKYRIHDTQPTTTTCKILIIFTGYMIRKIDLCSHFNINLRRFGFDRDKSLLYELIIMSIWITYKNRLLTHYVTNSTTYILIKHVCLNCLISVSLILRTFN